MRIVLWPSLSLPNIGGLEIQTQALAKQLQHLGHEVIVMSSHSKSKNFQRLEIDGVTIFLFPFVAALVQKNLLLIKKNLEQAQKVLNDFSPDVVNVHGWYEQFAFYQERVLSKQNYPVCLTIHGLLDQHRLQAPACTQLWVLAKAVNVVSVSMKDVLMQSHWASPKIRLIYNGLAAMPEPLVPIVDNPPHVLMIGRLSEEKSFETGFVAVRKLISKYPDIRMTLVGGGPKYADLFELRRRLELESYVQMTDFVSPHRVREYLDSASMLLVPSFYEPFGLVALEAALRARPVIASDIPGLREVVESGVTGVLVPPRNAEALANSIDFLLTNPTILQGLGVSGYKRALQKFTIENTTNQYLQMYCEIQNKF